MTIKSIRIAVGIAVIITILILPWACLETRAQSGVETFEPTTTFSVPAYNGTINFGENGTYTNAVFQNNMWTFTDLQINGSQPLENFTVSAQNCSVAIFFYRVFDPIDHISFLQYVVEGKGVQILNLGFGPEAGGLTVNAEWSVILRNSVFVNEGQGWTITYDGTMSINGANGNVTIIHSGAFIGQSNLPFYEQHSVAIVIAVAVAAVVSVGIVINVNIRRHQDDMD